MSIKKPYSKFYWSDWRNEMSLKLCSLSARGLWMEMLAIMGLSERVGYLQIGGRQITEQQLAIMSGVSLKEIQSCLKELEDNNVFSRDESGIPFSRRMAKEGEEYTKAREFGLKGGSPILKTQKQESRSKNLEATDPLTLPLNPPLNPKTKDASGATSENGILPEDREYQEIRKLPGLDMAPEVWIKLKQAYPKAQRRAAVESCCLAWLAGGMDKQHFFNKLKKALSDSKVKSTQPARHSTLSAYDKAYQDCLGVLKGVLCVSSDLSEAVERLQGKYAGIERDGESVVTAAERKARGK